MVALRPLAVARSSSDKQLVQGRALLDGLSRRTPAIILFTLFAALVVDWVGAPPSLPRGLAIFVGCLALILFATSGRRKFDATQDREIESTKSWIAYELAGKGTPPGFYALGFFVIVTLVLTGMESPYSLPAWAALGLGLAWGRANANYPVDEE